MCVGTFETLVTHFIHLRRRRRKTCKWRRAALPSSLQPFFKMHLVSKVKIKCQISIDFHFPLFPPRIPETTLGLSSFLADRSGTDPSRHTQTAVELLPRIPRGTAPHPAQNNLLLFQYSPFPTSDLTGDNRVRNGHGTLKIFC